MKGKIQNIRRAVCIMANELHKTGLTLSQAFKKAWRRVKESMTIRAAGTAFGNRQERLAYIAQFKPNELQVTLQREPENSYDQDAVKVFITVLPIRKYTQVGYLPKSLSKEVAKVMDAGVDLKAELKGIIGGYSYKEHYGVLLNIAV